MPDGKATPKPVVTIPSRYDLDALLVLPDEKSVKDINQVSRTGPKYVSLKDHPEFSGKAILVKAAEVIPGTIPDSQTGAINDYVRAVCAIYPPERKPTKEDVCILQTGAGEVARRLCDAITENAFPVRGILHQHGRAWTLD